MDPNDLVEQEPLEPGASVEVVKQLDLVAGADPIDCEAEFSYDLIHVLRGEATVLHNEATDVAGPGERVRIPGGQPYKIRAGGAEAMIALVYSVQTADATTDGKA